MLGNLPVVQMFKRLTSKNSVEVEEALPTFYDLYKAHNHSPWNVKITELDLMKIQHAIKTNKPIPITKGLTDSQLLKLHAPSFPEFDNQLVYHAMFDLYEIKYEKETVYIFSYNDGKYTPVLNIL